MKTHTPRCDFRFLVTVALALSLPAGAYAQRADRDESPSKIVLFNGRNLDGWKLRTEDRKDTWKVVSTVALDSSDDKRLTGTGEGGRGGSVLFRAPVEHGSDLLTEKSFGDCRLHIELMVPKNSNSGVYLMGRYEVQVFDSFGKPDKEVAHSDMGGIYSVNAPATNASRAPGEWQELEVVFRAPRFDADGNKTENARFEKVMLNGKTIQENVEVKGPTGGELPGGEQPTGPLMLQGDHGIVAYRNIVIEPAK